MNIKELIKKIEGKSYLPNMQLLLTHIKDLEESCDGYALHLEQVCEDLYNLKADKKDLEVKIKTKVDLAKDLVKRIEQLEAENKRLREGMSACSISYCRRLIAEINTDIDALSKDKEQNAGNAVSK